VVSVHGHVLACVGGVLLGEGSDDPFTVERAFRVTEDRVR